MKSVARRGCAGAGANWVLYSGDLFPKVIRFTVVGVLSGTIYALVTLALIGGLGMSPVAASIGGYCASVPASFLGHRSFSFRSDGRWTHEALRFVVTQALNITVSAGSMYAATHYFATHYGWGMIGAVVLVPIVNFALNNLWVFRRQSGRREG